MSFVDVPVSHGRLEGVLWKAEAPRGAVVVCHPHPLHGGTMHNHVTYRIAKAFRDRGISTLRFNYRGVGRSTGSYDEGRGELEDRPQRGSPLQQSARRFRENRGERRRLAAVDVAAS